MSKVVALGGESGPEALLGRVATLSREDAARELTLGLSYIIAHGDDLSSQVVVSIDLLRERALKYVLSLNPSATEDEGRAKMELMRLLGCNVHFSEASSSAVHVLLNRARALRAHTQVLAEREAILDRAESALKDAQSRIREHEYELFRRMSRDADVILLRREAEELREKVRKLQASMTGMKFSIASGRDKLRCFRAALHDARQSALDWNTLMTWIARDFSPQHMASQTSARSTPEQRMHQLFGKFHELTSDQLLWALCEEWRLSGAISRKYMMAANMFEVVLDMLQDGSDVCRDTDVTHANFIPYRVPSTFRSWSASVRRRFGT